MIEFGFSRTKNIGIVQQLYITPLTIPVSKE